MQNKLPKYPHYKPSNIDWLGDIPEHWEATRVKNIFRIVVEPAPKNNDFELLSVYTEIGVKPRKELEEKGNKASTTDGYWFVKKGDIVVNKLLAWMGAIGISNYDGVTSPAYDILRAKIEINGNYYHYLFRNEVFISEMKKYSRGIMDMRLRLYFDKFSDIIVPLPNFEEQTKIVDYLDDKTAKIDKAIATKQRQIELLKERRQVLIHKAVTRGIAPFSTGEGGTPRGQGVRLKNSNIEWIGEIPEHWEESKVKWELDFHNNKRIPIEASKRGDLQGDYPYYGASGVIDYVNDYIFDGKFILIGEDGANILNRSTPLAFIVEGKFWVNNHAHILKAKNGQDEYFTYQIELNDFTNLASGSAQPKLTKEAIANLSLFIPPLSEQKSIVNYLDEVSSKIAKAISLKEQEILVLKEYKSSLINSVVKGKVRVI